MDSPVDTPETVAEEVAGGAAAAMPMDAVTADAVVPSVALPVSSEALPMPVLSVPAVELPVVGSAVQVDTPSAVEEVSPPLDAAPPRTEASLGLAALALAGVFALVSENSRRESEEADES